MMRFEFDNNGYVCCILYGCTSGKCVEYTGLVPNEPEEYADMDDWADHALVQAYYLDGYGNLTYDAERAAQIQDGDSMKVMAYTSQQAKEMGMFDLIYPVGSIYMSMNNVSPETLFYGTWRQLKDKFMLAAGSKFSGGTTGGAESYELSTSHKHIAPVGSTSSRLGLVSINGTVNGGSGKAFQTTPYDASGTLTSNVSMGYTSDAAINATIPTLPPYLAVYAWLRVLDTVSGNVISFDNGLNLPLDIQTKLEPMQLGKREPCVAGAGKNLFSTPENNLSTTAAFSVDPENGSFEITQTAEAGSFAQLYYPLELDASKYTGKTLTFSFRSYFLSDAAHEARLFLVDDDGKSLVILYLAGNQPRYKSFVVPEGCKSIKAIMRIDQKQTSAPGSQLKIAGVQLEEGSSATAFESYTNIRPISGYTNLKRVRAGKNLIKNTAVSQTINGVTFTVNADGSVKVKGTTTARNTFLNLNYVDYNTSFLVPGNYILSGASGDVRVQLAINKDIRVTAENTNGDVAFTVPKNVENTWARIQIPNANTVVDTTVYPMVRHEGITDDAYEAYRGDDYTVQIGQTVYGGKFDWATGKLTAEYGFVELTGNESVNVYSENASLGNGATIYNVLPNAEYRALGVSSHAVVHKYLDTKNRIIVGNNNQHIFWMTILDSLGITTAAEFKSWLAAQKSAGTPVQVAYKLGTPIEIQLENQNITLLEGKNTIYGDGIITCSVSEDLPY